MSSLYCLECEDGRTVATERDYRQPPLDVGNCLCWEHGVAAAVERIYDLDAEREEIMKQFNLRESDL
jgi:hypothetical protein